MPDVTLSTDIDAFLKTANDAAARTELGLGSAAEAATGDFATAAEGILAGTALQPADPTLESVTDNGATTLNDIQVGRIVTAGNTLGPVATAVDSIAIGGTGNSATGPQSEVLGGGGSSATATGSTIVGGNSSNNSGNWAIIAGGRNHTNTAGARSGILGGEYANVTHADSSMLSVRGTNIANKESQAVQTAHVDNLHIFEGGFKMPTGATDTYVLTTDATGVGTWQAAAGGGGTVQGTDGTYDIQATSEGGIIAGNARGEYSVDLQTYRFAATKVASGLGSVIAGGSDNTASAIYTVVSGGGSNTASADLATVGGGTSNTASGKLSVISGGSGNTVVKLKVILALLLEVGTSQHLALTAQFLVVQATTRTVNQRQ